MLTSAKLILELARRAKHFPIILSLLPTNFTCICADSGLSQKIYDLLVKVSRRGSGTNVKRGEVQDRRGFQPESCSLVGRLVPPSEPCCTHRQAYERQDREKQKLGKGKRDKRDSSQSRIVSIARRSSATTGAELNKITWNTKTIKENHSGKILDAKRVANLFRISPEFRSHIIQPLRLYAFA